MNVDPATALLAALTALIDERVELALSKEGIVAMPTTPELPIGEWIPPATVQIDGIGQATVFAPTLSPPEPPSRAIDLGEGFSYEVEE